ncbi:MAG: iron uptake porin [Thermosynechococcaceae cyanobacterium MS004]|nr:iron uptake porin [Thermosynechococcaceae cyanobacterium MS004]
MKRAFLLAGSLGLIGFASQAGSALADQSTSVADLMKSTKSTAIGQVTSVSQLSDVQPTDWAFQALQSLVERYGCIAGYPDGTFRGNRAATRYELAAALNACLDQISDRFATKEDLEAVKALQEEFKAELATLKGRVDGLEARTATLEAQQFSTTTKLVGEVVMAVQYGDTINANPNVAGGNFVPSDSRATALARVRLNFNTSFTGSDLLQTQLEVGNGGNDLISNAAGSLPFVLGSGQAVSGGAQYDLGAIDYSGTNPNVTLRRLAYSFKPAKNVTVTIGPRLFPSDFVDFNSYANNSAQDFSSGVFINNPLIINNVVDTAGGAGAAIDWNFGGGPFTARATYVAASPTNSVANPVFGGGLFGDPYQATAELEYARSFGAEKKSNVAVRAQYTRSSSFNVHQDVVGLNGEATFGRFGAFGRVGYSINPKFGVIGPDVDYADVILAGGNTNGILTWQAGVGVKDLVIPGSLLAAAVGQPYLVFGQAGPEQTNYEAFYRFPINDNITITPAVMLITDVGNANTDTIIQGVLRATFSF